MANVTAATKFFPTANKDFTDNLSSTISSGAATIPVNSAAEYSNGEVVVWVIAPGTANQVAVTGTISGNSIINAVWTDGTAASSYASGTAVVDWVTATDQALYSKGLLIQHAQDGTHAAITASSLTSSGAISGTAVTGSGAGQFAGVTSTNSTAQFKDESSNTVDIDPVRRNDGIEAFDYIVSGLNPTSASGLVVTIPAGVFYKNGKRYSYAGGTKTLGASKDCYLDIDTSGAITSVEVALGATAGMTLTTNGVRFSKISTGAASVTTYWHTTFSPILDPLGNSIYHGSPQMRDIESAFATGADFTTASATLVDVTGMTFVYQTGASAERITVTLDAHISNTTGAAPAVTLSINGVDQAEYSYNTSTATNLKVSRVYKARIPANTAATIKLRALTSGGTMTVYKSTQQLLPTVRGYGIRGV